MHKKNIHPKWYQAEVFCQGKKVFYIGSAKPRLFVEIWSGNHPFYTKSLKPIDTVGRLKNYENKYINNLK